MSNKDGRIPLNATLLKECRKKLGLSQEKLAEHSLKKGLLVSVSSIKRAELGMNVLYRTATHLAKFYGLPTEALLTETTSKALTKTTPQVSRTAPIIPYYKKSVLTIVLEIGAQYH